MDTYAIDRLMSQTRRLAKEYHEQTGQTLPVTLELARYDCKRLLEFDYPLSENSGVDLLGQGQYDQKPIQVKGRVIFDENKSGQRIGQFKLNAQWEYTALIIFNQDYEPEEIYLASRDTLVNQLESHSKNKRGLISVAKFKHLGQRLWSQESGLMISESGSEPG